MFRAYAFILMFISGFTFAAQKTLPAKEKKQLVDIMGQYEKLHKAFFDYDGDKVAVEANKLKESLEKINEPEIAKLLKVSKEKLAEIKAKKTREENNQSLHLVSMALMHILETYNISSNYKQFECPMVKKKWIQNVTVMSEVHNPYAGDMPHCGYQSDDDE